MLAQVADEADAEHRERREAYARDLAATEQELANARREWEDALSLAARRRAEAEAGAEAADEGIEGMRDLEVQAPEIVERLRAQLAEVAGAMQGATRRALDYDVAGTFNALAARGLGAAGAADRTADATEETARNTRRIVREMQQNQLVFE